MVAACPSRDVLQHVTSRWGILVLVALETGTLRFSQLRRKIDGVSERMLAQALQDLEADGFIDRQAYEVVPPHVEYSLTPRGQEVSEKVRLLADWIADNLPRIIEVQRSDKPAALEECAPSRPARMRRRRCVEYRMSSRGYKGAPYYTAMGAKEATASLPAVTALGPSLGIACAGTVPA